MKFVRERKAQCPAFGHVILREDLAVTRLPEDGIPDHVHCCAQHVEGSDKALSAWTDQLPRHLK